MPRPGGKKQRRQDAETRDALFARIAELEGQLVECRRVLATEPSAKQQLDLVTRRHREAVVQNFELTAERSRLMAALKEALDLLDEKVIETRSLGRQRDALMDEKTELANALRNMTRDVAAKDRHIHQLQAQIRELQATAPRGASAETGVIRLDRAAWREFTLLCHPDRHAQAGSERLRMADSCTRLLMQARPPA